MHRDEADQLRQTKDYLMDDDKQRKLDTSIKAFRLRQAKNHVEPATFCGKEVAEKEHFQEQLDQLDCDERSKMMTMDLTYQFSDRVHKLMLEAFEEEDNPNLEIKEDAKSLAREWAGVIGMDDLTEDDFDEDEGLAWVSTRFLDLIHKQKESYNKLFDKNE